MREPVVLVHGLWMRGRMTALLARRLENLGFQTGAFSYPSIRREMAENVARLHDFAGSFDAERVHLVGHSLGGVLIQRMFDEFEVHLGGRVVLLGAPLLRSSAAEGVAGLPWGTQLLGRTGAPALLGARGARWHSEREVGAIAGSLGVGIGQWFTQFRGPHDGTVAVEETRVEGLADHLVLPVTHTGLLLSPTVAKQTAHFLRYGRFERRA